MSMNSFLEGPEFSHSLDVIHQHLHFPLLNELWVFLAHLLELLIGQKKRNPRQGMTLPLWRGSLLARLTFPWHGITGLLLRISACAALIMQCDQTEIVHYIDCVGPHYHQLHISLFDPKLHLNASEIWSTTFNQMCRLTNPAESSLSLYLLHKLSLQRYTARQLNCSASLNRPDWQE